MVWLKQHLRHLLILIAVQSFCLALGWWIYQNLVVGLLTQAADETALAELAADADGAQGALDHCRADGEPLVPAGPTDVFPAAAANRTVVAVQWTLVDPQWRVVRCWSAGAERSPTSLPSREHLVWTESPDGQGNLDRIVGLLDMPGGSHLAAARALSNGEGYIVAHCPRDAIRVSTGVLARSLPAAGVIGWAWTSVLLTVATCMVVTGALDSLAKKTARSEAKTLEQIQSLVRTRDALVLGLAKLAESRDQATGAHLDRVSAYTVQLAVTVRHDRKYRDVVTPEFIQLIGGSSTLHDVGKVAIEDSILHKHGPLTEAERARMQQHTTIGADTLRDIERRLGSSNFLQMAREIALSHHERWDGSGYPQGLAGDEIPLAARIVAIADSYEALSSQRDYKPPLPHDECVRLIRREAGRQFDPDLVAAFFRVEGSFHRIACQYGNLPWSADSSDDPSAAVTCCAESRTILGDSAEGPKLAEPVSSQV